MSYPHVIVWLDHQKATVIDFSVDEHHLIKLVSENPRQLHRKSGSIGAGRAPDDKQFFDEVAKAVQHASEILITGPGTAKAAFMAELDKRHAAVAKHVVGVESLDHPSDAELLAFAKKYFRRVDALRGDA